MTFLYAVSFHSRPCNTIEDLASTRLHVCKVPESAALRLYGRRAVLLCDNRVTASCAVACVRRTTWGPVVVKIQGPLAEVQESQGIRDGESDIRIGKAALTTRLHSLLCYGERRNTHCFRSPPSAITSSGQSARQHLPRYERMRWGTSSYAIDVLWDAGIGIQRRRKHSICSAVASV